MKGLRVIAFYLFTVLLFAIPAVYAFSFGTAETTGQSVTITGTVRLVGNEPFTELVISDAQGTDWYIADSEREKLSRFEQRTVTVRARVELKPMVLANGKKLDDKRILTGIRVTKH